MRLKSGKRNDLKKRSRKDGRLIDRVQELKEARLTFASTLASWIIKNNIAIAPNNVPVDLNTLPPWSDGLFLARAEKREEIKFPGQAIGRSLSVRTEVTAPKTNFNFIMHQLLTKRNFRFDITLNAWRALSLEYTAQWQPRRTAPWNLLQQTFNFPEGPAVGQAFANMWIQVSFLIPQFQLTRGWLERGQQNSVYQTFYNRPADDPVYLAWLEYWSSENDIKDIPVESWQNTNTT